MGRKTISKAAKVSIILVVTVVSGAVAIMMLFPSIFAASPTSNSISTIHFTIVLSDPSNLNAGMNGSYYKSPSAPWPLLHARVGQAIEILVINDGVEPHGFAISHYFNAGVALSPNNSYNVTFVANQPGTFRMYCSFFCVIYSFMQNGQLIIE